MAAQGGADEEVLWPPLVPELIDLYDASCDLRHQRTALSREDVDRLYEVTQEYWTRSPPEDMSYREYCLDRLGIVAPAMPSLDELKLTGRARISEIINLKMQLKKHSLYQTEDQQNEVLPRILTGCRLAYEYIEREVLSRGVHSGELYSSYPLPRHIGAFSMSFIQDDDGHTGTQQLIRYMLEKMRQMQYRRLGGQCYREIKVGGCGTHAWEEVMKISDFVYACCHTNENVAMWENLTKAGNAHADVTRYLTNCTEKDFPALDPDRYLFAFRNGQYDVQESSFYPISGEGSLHDERVAIKFFDIEFDEDVLMQDDWRDIATPLFDSIFEYQNYEQDTLEMVYVMLGRLLFAVNEHDMWSVVPEFVGAAGCGKSTVAAVIANWFPPQFVGTISCNMEEKFGLSALVDCFVCLCTEVTSRFPIPRGVWQQMVTGEPVNVPRKNTDPKQGPWTVPIALFGNEILPYRDTSGSIHRRMAYFNMMRQVDPSAIDPTMLHRLQKDAATQIVKFSRAYLDKIREHANKGYWKPGIATSQQLEWQKRRLIENDPFTEYIESSGRVETSETGYIPEDDLKRDFKEWLKDKHSIDFRRKEHWSEDHVTTVLQRKAAQKKTERKPWPMDGPEKTQSYILNLVLTPLSEDVDMGINGGIY